MSLAGTTAHYGKVTVLRLCSDVAVPILEWWWSSSIANWRAEISRAPGWPLYLLFAALGAWILAPMAFENGILFGMSYAYSMFVAISFAWILRHPLASILVYVGVIVGSAAMSLFHDALGVASSGQLLPALIMSGLGIVLTLRANRLKRSEIG